MLKTDSSYKAYVNRVASFHISKSMNIDLLITNVLDYMFLVKWDLLVKMNPLF